MGFDKMIKGSLILALSLLLNLFANDGKLQGIVVDSETNKAINAAEVSLVDDNLFTTTNFKGEFEFSQIDHSEHLLKVTHVAYQESVTKVKHNPNDNKRIIIYLIPKTIEIAPVIITGQTPQSKFDDLYEVSNVLKGKELEKDLGQTLAATLKNETGLAIRSMGPAPARPVIRGLGGDRVHISEDGNKTTDLSSTSPDHAVSIEPFGVSRIEVLRGPKVLLKSPTTIGGVVNIIRNEIPEVQHNQMYGTVGAYTETANKGYLGMLNAEAPIGDFAVRGDFSRRRTNDVSTPVGVLKNSSSENMNYSAGGAYFAKFGYLGYSFRNFELNYGVPGGFVGAHPNGVDIEMYRIQNNIKGKVNLGYSALDNIEFHLSQSTYRHKEFGSKNVIGSEFKINNYFGYADFNHNKFLFFNSGTYGLSFESRDFTVGGFVFTPQSKSFNLAAYIFETASVGKFSFEFGARYNFDKITPKQEKPNAKIGHIKERTYNTYSLSFSTLYEISNLVYVGFNINSSSRVPTIEELFSEGPHLAAYSYEVGNPYLESERGFGSEVFVYHKFKNLYFNLNVFRNDIPYYIIPRNTGEINYATFLPIYKTFGVGAIMYGIENQIDWNVTDEIKLSSSVSYSRGEFKSGGSLPQIPALKGIFGISYTNDFLSLGVNSEMTADQNFVDAFEDPTAGYIIFNTFAQYSIYYNDFIHNISLNIDNILNTEYRNHLSRIKVILPEAGVNLRLTYKMYFHL